MFLSVEVILKPGIICDENLLVDPQADFCFDLDLGEQCDFEEIVWNKTIKADDFYCTVEGPLSSPGIFIPPVSEAKWSLNILPIIESDLFNNPENLPKVEATVTDVSFTVSYNNGQSYQEIHDGGTIFSCNGTKEEQTEN